MIIYKKGIGPIVATALLLVVSVVAVISFQTWFATFSSQIFTDIDTKSTDNQFSIETLVGDTLYVKSLSDNFTINTIKIGGVDCNLNATLSTGMNNISVTDCLSSITTKTPNIVLISDSGIADKQVYLPNVINNNLLNSNTNTYFVSVWNTSKTSVGSSNSNQVKLPLESMGTYNFVVDWGDNSNESINLWNSTSTTHTYSSAGIYQINISGTIQGFRFNGTGDRLKLKEIKSWGPLNLGNRGEYFSGVTDLVISSTDNLNLTGTNNLTGTFRGATNFNSNIENWDVSSVNETIEMFMGATNFNQPLNLWDVSSVTKMNGMFAFAQRFNQSLDNWDVSSVTSMWAMFALAFNYNQDLSGWNVSSVTNCWNFCTASTPIYGTGFMPNFTCALI